MASNNNRIGGNQTIVTARRALGFGKMYLLLSIIIGIGVIFYIAPPIISAAAGPKATGDALSTILLVIPFTVLPMIMLVNPMVVLFVYDKNNGMLEYLLSLGMTQRDIYWRYLSAALLLAFVYLVVFVSANLVSTQIRYSSQLPEVAELLTIGVVLALATVAFIINMMMTFSVLQKARAGGNQPLAMTLGVVGVVPGYFIPFVLPFTIAIDVDIAVAAIIAIAALTLVVLSGRLIKREKLLP